MQVCNHPELFERREPRSPLYFPLPPLILPRLLVTDPPRPPRHHSKVRESSRGFVKVKIASLATVTLGSIVSLVCPGNYKCCRSGMFIPDPNFSIPDPGSGSACKNLRIINPKNCFWTLGNMIRDVRWLFTHPRSRGQKRLRIPDPDPQHW